MIVTIAGSAFTFSPNDDELAAINLEFAAFDGEIGSGQFPVPDPATTLAPVTGRQFKVAQDAALLTDGFMLDWDRTRGPFRVGTQSEYAISVQDANALLDGFRIQQNRPSETDYARVIAFAAAYGTTLAVPWDTTWVLNSSTATMPAKKYDADGGFGDLIEDLVSFTGKTLFLHDKAAGGRCLHYHILTTGHTCGLSISDVVTAQNGVTVFAPLVPDDQDTSVDLVNNVKGRDQSGRTSVQSDATSIAAHDADGLFHQALLDFDATSQSDLNTQTAAALASNKNDYHSYTCTIGPLDGTALGLIRVGDIITVTSGAMGLTASAQRIAHVRLKTAGGPKTGTWWAELEMGAPVRRRHRLSNVPALAAAIAPLLPPSVLPVLPPFTSNCATPQEVFIGNGTLSPAGSVDDADVYDSLTLHTMRGARMPFTFSPPVGSGTAFDQSVGVFLYPTTPHSAGDAGYLAAGIVSVRNDLGTASVTIVSSSGSSSASFTPASNTFYELQVDCIGTAFAARVLLNGTSLASAGRTGTAMNLCQAAIVDATALVSWTLAYSLTGLQCAPTLGQSVIGEFIAIGDGVTTSFTTAYAYRSGSLRLQVSGSFRVFAFSENDPTLGTFDFASPPFNGELIYADYDGG